MIYLDTSVPYIETCQHDLSPVTRIRIDYVSIHHYMLHNYTDNVNKSLKIKALNDTFVGYNLTIVFHDHPAVTDCRVCIALSVMYVDFRLKLNNQFFSIESQVPYR